MEEIMYLNEMVVANDLLQLLQNIEDDEDPEEFARVYILSAMRAMKALDMESEPLDEVLLYRHLSEVDTRFEEIYSNLKNEKVIAALVESIKGWDKEDIRDLREHLLDLVNLIGNRNIDEVGIDISDLPSEEIPDEVDTAYPIWAMDKKGMCLVGDDAFDPRLRQNNPIESLEEIKENYAKII